MIYKTERRGGGVILLLLATHTSSTVAVVMQFVVSWSLLGLLEKELSRLPFHFRIARLSDQIFTICKISIKPGLKNSRP